MTAILLVDLNQAHLIMIQICEQQVNHFSSVHMCRFRSVTECTCSRFGTDQFPSPQTIHFLLLQDVSQSRNNWQNLIEVGRKYLRNRQTRRDKTSFLKIPGKTCGQNSNAAQNSRILTRKQTSDLNHLIVQLPIPCRAPLMSAVRYLHVLEMYAVCI